MIQSLRARVLPAAKHQPTARFDSRPDVGEGGDGVVEEHDAEAADGGIEAGGR
jgi:hypothetical protein